MSPQSDFDKIADRLKGMSRDGSSIEAAQVKLIGLDEIREAAGPRWPRMRDRVRSGSMAILAQHTGPGDVVIPAGDGFLIVLAEGRAGQTQQRCQAMRDALLAFYLGEEALKSLRAEVNNRALTADGLTDLIASSVAQHQQGPHAAPARFVAKGREVAQVRVFGAQEKKLAAHLCAPVVHERGTRRIAYNSEFILDGKHAKADFLELDIAILDEALTLAAKCKAEGANGFVGFSVHATTMQLRRARESYLNWLNEVDPDVKRHLFVTIAEIEKGTPLISISEWTSALRSHAAKVSLDFHYTDHAIASVGGAGAWAAGFHLPIYTGAQKAPRAQRMLDQLMFWSKSIHGQGMRLMVHGFQEPEFLTSATKLGVDFVTSEAMWPFKFADHSVPESEFGAADGAELELCELIFEC